MAAHLCPISKKRASVLLTVHEHIVSLLQKPDPVILDIGCNDGTDAQCFLRLCPEAKLYCFEPDARAAARFKTT